MSLTKTAVGAAAKPGLKESDVRSATIVTKIIWTHFSCFPDDILVASR